MKRRTLLSGMLGLAAMACAPLARAAHRRVVIVGGGWGGLATARQLRTLAPQIEVVVIERNTAFRSLPLSNRWLVGLARSEKLVHDYRATAARHGYQFVQDEVVAIDRTARKVITQRQALAYDWLVIAAGIREDFSSWYGQDKTAADYTRQNFTSAFLGGDDLLRLKAKLENYSGGDLAMTIPPMPYRCPPAPYERAGMIAWWIKEHRIKGHLIVLDPNQPSATFSRICRDTYSNEITYLPQSHIKTVDPYKKRITTDFDTIDFAEAILLPPQQAADVVWQAGLIAQGVDGKTTGWAAQDPLSLNAIGDDRIFLVGDLLGRASPLFGFYPKTGQIAARLGAIAAEQIVARERGLPPSQQLPASSCYVVQRVAPMEISRLDSSYRLRADGLIQQSVKQTDYPQAENEDVAWAQTMFGELGFDANSQ
jgi:NADH dehydrogenase FAD-containing subunit